MRESLSGGNELCRVVVTVGTAGRPRAESREPRARQASAMFERIESIDDPRIAAYRDLPDPELVRRRGLFIAEGRLVIRRVIADGRWHIHSVLVNQAARESLASALDAVAERTPVYLCDAEAFCGITGFNIHRGCLALVERPAAQPPEAVIAQAHTVVVLEA